MTKVKLIIELEYDESIMHGDTQEEIDWFYAEILTPGELILYSNELGDSVGKITKIEVL